MNIYFENLYKSFDGKKVFENISGKIENLDRIGLIGVNGVGKTTLAKVLSGKEFSEKGKIVRSSGLKVLYIDQYPEFNEKISVYDELFKTALSNANNKVPDAVTKKALNKVGLVKGLWNQRAASLSGGEKTKLMLGKVLVSDFDLLILDEPTNHLDMESSQWLEKYLKNLKTTLLVISHDRFFLDNVVSKIWDLTPETLKVYKGNYSEYKVQKENELKNTMKEYEKQQLKIQNLEKAIEHRKNWYASAHKSAGQNDFYRSKAKKHASTMKAKKKELERLESNKIDKPKKATSPAFEIINKSAIDEKLPPVLVRIENIFKNYGRRILFKNSTFSISRKDKIALIGANGTGKTTLLKIIKGDDKDFKGEVSVSPSVKIGYFSQELDSLNDENSILDDVLLAGTNIYEARMLLAGLLFRGDDVYKKICNLSMGEKGRVAFAKLILSGANLLILDEPTNYMDIISREKIEDVLDEFQGSVIFVSHDRYFIRRIANKIIKIENQELKCYEGDYDYYLYKCQEEELHEEIGEDYNQVNDNIKRLECELAFLSGKLAQTTDEEEKEQLNDKFMKIARELNRNRAVIEELTK